MMSIALPLLLVGVAFAVAACFERQIPTGLRVYRLHVIAYPVVAVLGFAAAVLMSLSSSIDRWLDDATVHLELLFGIAGVVLCLVLAPVLWWVERQPELTGRWRVGRIAVSLVTLAPYVLIAGIVLFYRE